MAISTSIQNPLPNIGSPSLRTRWCGKRKAGEDSSSIAARLSAVSAQARPLFSSTTPRRRWIESLKSIGKRLGSQISSQATRIQSLWADPTPVERSPELLPAPPPPITTLPELLPPVPPFFSRWLTDNIKNLKYIEDNPFIYSDQKKSKEKKEEILSKVIAIGGNPFEKDSEGNCALDYAIRFNFLRVLKILTQTTSHKAFDSCKTVHDFFAVLFPPFRDRFPPNWEQYVQMIPKSAEIIECEKEAEKLPETEKLPRLWGKVIDFLSKEHTTSLEALSEVLAEKSPFFRKAWELANHPQKVGLLESSDEDFFIGGKRVFKEGEGGAYCSMTHSISINSNTSLYYQANVLIFETLNALCRTSEEMLTARYPEREEYAFSKEWMEQTNENIWSYVTDSDLLSPSIEKKQERWKKKNTPETGNESISHTEFYRREWDCTQSIQYLEKNPEFLKKRLKELETVAAVSNAQSEPTELKNSEF